MSPSLLQPEDFTTHPGGGMTDNPAWMFNERKLAGVDYKDEKVAAEYENRHGFRNFREEARKISEALHLSDSSTVLDIGCGTGGLSVHLAEKCGHVYAVDVSEEMIGVLERKISNEKIRNITAVAAGFLEYRHTGDPVDAIICNVALHHLPDFWKQIALRNFHSILGDEGKLFLADVVFDFSPDDYRKGIDDWLTTMRTVAGNSMSDEMIIHIRDEYSTWDWVMTGMLEKAGFTVLANMETMKNMRVYICVK